MDVLMDFAIRGSIRLRLQWKPPIIGFLDHIKQPFFFSVHAMLMPLKH